MKKGLLLLLLVLVVLLGLFVLFQHLEQDKYGMALELYQKGNESEDTLVKNQLMNESLEVLLSIEEETPAKNVLIGTILARLRQHPLAVYYQLLALQQDPENKQIQEQLRGVIQKGKLPTVVPSFFKLHGAKVLFSMLFLAGVAVLALALWSDWRWVQKVVYYLAVPLGLFGVVLAARIFFAPIYGVMIHAQELYQEAGKKEAILSPIPLSAGAVVTVLGEEQRGKMLKIRTGDGVLGYVPEDAIRVLK